MDPAFAGCQRTPSRSLGVARRALCSLWWIFVSRRRLRLSRGDLASKPGQPLDQQIVEAGGVGLHENAGIGSGAIVRGGYR